jgi:hypothetical protein
MPPALYDTSPVPRAVLRAYVTGSIQFLVGHRAVTVQNGCPTSTTVLLTP